MMEAGELIKSIQRIIDSIESRYHAREESKKKGDRALALLREFLDADPDNPNLTTSYNALARYLAHSLDICVSGDISQLESKVSMLSKAVGRCANNCNECKTARVETVDDDESDTIVCRDVSPPPRTARKPAAKLHAAVGGQRTNDPKMSGVKL